MGWNPRDAVDLSKGKEQERRTGMEIGQAVLWMRKGNRVSRAGWNGKDMWLAIQTPHAGPGQMDLPYVYIKTVDNKNVPWLCSQTDLLATDWFVVS
jgi:hypothetical protein